MFTRILLAYLLATVAAATFAPTTFAATTAAACRVVDPELQGFYQGGCRNGLAHGTGTARGEAEYSGGFRKGLKHGHGVKTWAWGDRYQGGFRDDRKHGRGMYLWGAGSPWAGERYVGEYLADRREGQGTYFWPNGDRFDGQWKADRRYGYSAMEQRRQATEAARARAFVPGVQVCAWEEAGAGRRVLRVGQIEAVAQQDMTVRLTQVQGDAGAGDPGAGSLVSAGPGEWVPCL